jgi:hypothetical protein
VGFPVEMCAIQKVGEYRSNSCGWGEYHIGNDIELKF